MDEKVEKSEQIVESIKLLEGVFKTSPNKFQKDRVKQEIHELRGKLKELYPNADIRELENAIYSSMMAIEPKEKERTLEDYECLKDIVIFNVSSHKEDQEINEASSIMRYFEERIWGVLSEQHTKLDFSNSIDRDSLHRNLDECERALKSFCQTIEDIKKASSKEYIAQLQLIRVRQGRLFLFEIHNFFKKTKKFVSSLIENLEHGGTMIENSEEKIDYADFEQFKTFDGWDILDTLEEVHKFIGESLEVINVPNI